VGGVDPTHLARLTYICGEGPDSVPETAPHIEQPLTYAKAQMVSFPFSQSACRFPFPCGVHRPQQHRDIQIAINSVITEPVSLLVIHHHEGTTA
jgi:hypothetical protein